MSFEETLLSCLTQKAYGTQPGHAQFYYPKKHGYGELWKRMADALGERIIYNAVVCRINFENKKVYLQGGESYSADAIITTIPWTGVRELKGMLEDIALSVSKLKHSSVETRYYSDNLDTEAQWIYYPDPSLAYHRILVRSNFCPNSKGYWIETNSQRVGMIPKEDAGNFSYMNQFAYPLNTLEKPAIMKRLLRWAQDKSVYGLERWGEWSHYNSDVTVDLAIKLAEKIR